jgi:hypothetical protein
MILSILGSMESFKVKGHCEGTLWKKRRGCCGVRGVYHNIKCGQEEGKKANTPFIKKTCYFSLHCLISNDSKKEIFQNIYNRNI